MHNEYLYGVMLYLLCPSSWYDVYIRNACLYKALYALMPFLPQVYLMFKKFDRFPKKIKYCFIYRWCDTVFIWYIIAQFNWMHSRVSRIDFLNLKILNYIWNVTSMNFLFSFFSVHILIWLKRKGPGFYLVNSFSS